MDKQAELEEAAKSGDQEDVDRLNRYNNPAPVADATPVRKTGFRRKR